MGDVAEFIRARLAEDQMDVELIPGGGYLPARWTAHRVADGEWAEIRQHDVIDEGDWEEVSTVALVRYGRNEDEHAARYDPRRILAEIKVKSALLEAFDLSQSLELPPDTWLILKPCVYAMAAIWAEHPDYDASWTVAGG